LKLIFLRERFVSIREQQLLKPKPEPQAAPQPNVTTATYFGDYTSSDSGRTTPVDSNSTMNLADMPLPPLQAIPATTMPATHSQHGAPLFTQDRYQRYDYAKKLSIAAWKRTTSLRLWYMSFEAKARGANLPLEDAVHGLSKFFSADISQWIDHLPMPVRSSWKEVKAHFSAGMESLRRRTSRFYWRNCLRTNRQK
jgi:hypothetical protein